VVAVEPAVVGVTALAGVPDGDHDSGLSAPRLPVNRQAVEVAHPCFG
jgi:hypothetical protein